MIVDGIRKLVARQDLSETEAFGVMACIMDGEATPAQIAAFVVALRLKGETSEEVCGLARAMRDRAVKVVTSQPMVLDTCGTGGDRLNTFNISTTAAFIAGAAGVPIAKHGNRAASSKCGSADVLEAMGVRITLSPESVGRLIDEVGIGFLFAPSLHPAMKYAAGPRKEIGVRTVFNILGPLTNPAGARRQVVGVYEEQDCELLAGALVRLGSERALVVNGLDGIDEVSTFCDTRICEVKDGQISTWTLRPEDAGLKRAKAADIEGGDAQRNAEIFMEILSGGAGPAREIACLNAGAALFVAGQAANIPEGLAKADRTISSGAAKDFFQLYRDRTLAEQ